MASKDKTKKEESFTLKLKGKMPVLAEVKDDPAMLKKNEEGEAISPARKSIKMKPCDIDMSLA